MSQFNIQIQRLNKDAILPTRGSEFAAGLDLSCIDDITISKNTHLLVKTGLRVKFPSGYYARIAPRSGISLKTGIMINAGVIDADYRGEIGIILVNPTPYDINIVKHTKIAQLILEKIAYPCVQDVESIDIDTTRGEEGFGSTDKH